jgi:hypothetical protein
MSRVALVTGDTQLCPDQGTTWGSLTIQDGGVQIRSGPRSPGGLLAAASKKLGVPSSRCRRRTERWSAEASS